MDIDLFDRTGNAPESLETIVREICGQFVEDDGPQFDDNSVSGAATWFVDQIHQPMDRMHPVMEDGLVSRSERRTVELRPVGRCRNAT